ncbi:uncharacterized protein LOC118198255, partial [Stegodyphus dumicola]|uniref:uncharacterized protein LOC118198255 n=1 Tax=Stegodyphus dumicola TaxID=202533 RepID=UPI0015A8383C
ETAEKAGLMPGDRIVCIDKVKVSKKTKEEIENIVKNAKEIMELEIIRPEGELATRKRQTSLRLKESFTKRGSKMVIQDSHIISWRKERALLKLLLCEEDLLNIITLGKRTFILPLRKQHTLTTVAEINILFGNIEEVGMVHEKHIQQLRQMSQGNDDSIGRLYQKQVDERFSVLRKYISGLHLANILLRFKSANKPFREFVEGPEASEDKISLSKFIEKPLHYLSEVTGLLESLLSCTAIGHRDYVCLESVISVFRTFGKEMNEAMNKLSSMEDLENIDTAFDGEEPYINLETLQEKTVFTKGPKDFSLIYPGRYWLFAGQLSKVEGKHYVQYWALLLSDCFILTRRTKQRVLLVLDEPVMLRSIYQATFDAQKCDTEFRILFAVENPQKAAGKRNQWITWILRAPSASVKLLWQKFLTQQLSYYSMEALSYGKKPCFVHHPGLKGLRSKRNINYEESSFVTLTGLTKFSTCHSGSLKSLGSPPAKDAKKSANENGSLTENNTKYEQPGCAGKVSDNLKPEKESHAFSSDQSIARQSAHTSKKCAVTRSKSFGNDFSYCFPFIDSPDATSPELDTHSSRISELRALSENLKNSSSSASKIDDCSDPEQSVPESHSAPETPYKSERYVQTDDSVPSPGTSRSKRTPKKKFPRLGTFERLKIDKRNANVDHTTSSTICRTRTGTSFRHRRQLSTTTSKEHLLKSDTVSSGFSDLKENTEDSLVISLPNEKKKRKLFPRFWKRESKSSNSDQSASRNAHLGGDIQLKENCAKEQPSSCVTVLNSPECSHVSV